MLWLMYQPTHAQTCTMRILMQRNINIILTKFQEFSRVQMERIRERAGLASVCLLPLTEMVTLATAGEVQLSFLAAYRHPSVALPVSLSLSLSPVVSHDDVHHRHLQQLTRIPIVHRLYVFFVVCEHLIALRMKINSDLLSSTVVYCLLYIVYFRIQYRAFYCSSPGKFGLFI